MIRRACHAALALAVLALLPAGATADERGQVFGDHTVAQNAQGADRDALLGELRALVDEAERSRAADPRFIRDLRQLLERHDQPKFELLVRDLFEDGDYTSAPRWQVTQGTFHIGRYGGLISEVLPPEPEPEQQGTRPNSEAEAVVRLFGQILAAQNRQDGNSQGSNGQGSTVQGSSGGQAATRPDPALIYLVQRMSNAFEVRARLESDPEAGGSIELGVFQGEAGRVGYRLVFGSGGEARLVRVGRSVSVLATAPFSMPELVDGWRNPGYDVIWRRDTRGQMTVTVDDRTLMEVADTAFRDPFDGLRLRNLRGRHALQGVEVHGLK